MRVSPIEFFHHSGVDQFLAFFFIVVGLIYGDTDSDNVWFAIVLPGLMGLSIMYVFWMRAFIAILIGYMSFQYMDIGSKYLFDSLVLPLLFGASIFYVMFWVMGFTNDPRGGWIDFTSADGDSGNGDSGGDGGCGGGD